MRVDNHRKLHFETLSIATEKQSNRSMSVKGKNDQNKFRAITDFAQAQLSKLSFPNLVTAFSFIDA